MKNTIKIILFIVCAFSYAQVQNLGYGTAKTNTVPFWDNDKQEIQDVVNSNAIVLDELDQAIDLLNGASIRTIQKTVNANTSVDFFSLQSSSGVLTVDVKVVSEGSNFVLIKNSDITFVKGDKGFFTNVSHSSPLHDFEIILTDIDNGGNIEGFTLSIQNLSLTENTTITLTANIGGTLNPITYTEL